MDFDELMKDLQNEAKEAEKRAKTQEEVEALLVDESLSDVEKAEMFIQKGIAVQRTWALERFAQLVKDSGPRALSKLLPVIKEAMAAGKFSVEERGTLARCLEEMIANRYIFDDEVEAQVLPVIMEVYKSPDEHIEDHVQHWTSALWEAAQVLGEVKVKALVLPEVKAMGKVYATPKDRCMSCYMTGAICKVVPKQEVKDQLLAGIVSLCQDTETSVRRAMASQLPPLATHLGAVLTDEKILPELFELMRDEERDVKETALRCLVEILDLVPDSSKKDKVMPRIHNIWQALTVEPVGGVADIFAELNGPLVVKVAKVLSNEDARVLIGCMRGLADHKSSEASRRFTAFNFYAVLHSLGVDYMARGMLSILQELCKDQDAQVRRTVARQLPDVCKLVGPQQAMNDLLPLYLNLMTDRDGTVSVAAVTNMKNFLQVFKDENHSDKTKLHMQLLDAMVKVDEDTKLNWRIQQALATTFASLPEYLTAQEMHDRVAPIVFRLLGPEVAAAVRRPAAEALVRVIRMPELKVQQRTDLYLRVIKEFAKGKSFWQRSIFVDICDSLLHIFSTKFFREHFFGPCIDLMSDPVPNIRLKVCELLPDLKQTIRLPDDVEFLDRLNTAVSGLMTDNDRDVSMRARAMNDAFKSKPFRMARAAVSSGSGGFEAEDKRREKEEESVVFTKEEVEKIRYQALVERNMRKNTSKFAGAAGDSGAGASKGGSRLTMRSRPKPGGAAASAAPAAGTGVGAGAAAKAPAASKVAGTPASRLQSSSGASGGASPKGSATPSTATSAASSRSSSAASTRGRTASAPSASGAAPGGGAGTTAGKPLAKSGSGGTSSALPKVGSGGLGAAGAGGGAGPPSAAGKGKPGTSSLPVVGRGKPVAGVGAAAVGRR